MTTNTRHGVGDCYTCEQALQLRLRGMKQERKEAEERAKLLDNRLNMLKKEEDRQWKQIDMSFRIFFNTPVNYISV